MRFLLGFSCPYHAIPESADNLLEDIPNAVGVGFFNESNNLGDGF